jgi:hypothetical protein
MPCPTPNLSFQGRGACAAVYECVSLNLQASLSSLPQKQHEGFADTLTHTVGTTPQSPEAIQGNARSRCGAARRTSGLIHFISAKAHE